MTGFGMIDCSTLHFLGWNSLDGERYVGKADEKLFTYTDKYIRHFAQYLIKNGRLGAFNKVLERL